MSPAFRSGSLLARIRQAFSGETRAKTTEFGFLPPQLQTDYHQGFGSPPRFSPTPSQQAYSDNTYHGRLLGTLKRMTWGFRSVYGDEAFAILSLDWLANEKRPSGFDLRAFAGALKSLVA
jgi:hypothetical protein